MAADPRSVPPPRPLAPDPSTAAPSTAAPSTADRSAPDRSGTDRCPECDAALATRDDYRRWCERCEWNLQTPLETIAPRGFAESFRLRLSERYGAALLAEIADAAPEALRARPPLAALLLASGVHLTALLLGAVGAWLVIAGFPNPFALLVGGLALALAWFARPRSGRAPEGALERAEHRTLYELADRVAAVLGVPPVDAIVLSPAFGAAYTELGRNRARVLELGLPLATSLSEDELVALVAHELAHGANGDPLRGAYLGSAFDALVAWHRFARPASPWGAEGGPFGLLLLPLRLAQAALAAAIRAAARLLLVLSWRASQRSEYLADHQAAGVAGTPAMLALLERMHLHGAFVTAVQQVALGAEGGDVYEAFAVRVAAMPARERERLRRLQRRPSSRLDTTHPPTVHRSAALTRRPPLPAALVLSAVDAAAIRAELARHAPRLQRRLLERFRAGLYA